jgi:hypothetical protein
VAGIVLTESGLKGGPASGFDMCQSVPAAEVTRLTLMFTLEHIMVKDILLNLECDESGIVLSVMPFRWQRHSMRISRV